jgi:hypothetical protein
VQQQLTERPPYSHRLLFFRIFLRKREGLIEA